MTGEPASGRKVSQQVWGTLGSQMGLALFGVALDQVGWHPNVLLISSSLRRFLELRYQVRIWGCLWEAGDVKVEHPGSR